MIRRPGLMMPGVSLLLLSLALALVSVGMVRATSSPYCDPAGTGYPCQNLATCHNETVGVTPFHCDCPPTYCGQFCEKLCPYQAGKAVWVVRGNGVGGDAHRPPCSSASAL